MKSFVLAATVAAGLFFTANTADAQFFRRPAVYVAPSVAYPAYSYPAYSYPAYYGGVVRTGYYAPAYPAVGVYSSGYYSPYGYGYGSSYYSGYNGVYGSYYGGYVGGRWGW